MQQWVQEWCHELLKLKVCNNMGSQEDMTRTMQLLKRLPGVHSGLREALPGNYNAVEDIVSKLYGSEIYEYDICPKETCRGCVFRGELQHAEACPCCDTGRYKAPGIAAKTILYMPLSEMVRATMRDDELRKLLKVPF